MRGGSGNWEWLGVVSLPTADLTYQLPGARPASGLQLLGGGLFGVLGAGGAHCDFKALW